MRDQAKSRTRRWWFVCAVLSVSIGWVMVLHLIHRSFVAPEEIVAIPFETQGWLREHATLSRGMAEDLIQRRTLIGLTQTEVHALLGSLTQRWPTDYQT
jgi:hypothetical protein